MAEGKLSIRLIIDGRQYKLNVSPDKEEVYRRAESELNDYVGLLKRKAYKEFGDNDYLALAALKFAIEKVDMSRSREVTDDDMQALAGIDSRLESYLNELTEGE
ncbi:MAG: cell division protein ZapA [Alistipes sp.]|nr:cell division protein ZapA [Alistipes sp.]